jgi:type I restriction enzyme S subunit
MSALPNGWIISSIGNVVDKIIGGGTPSKSNNSYFEGDFPFMTVKDMKVSRPLDTIDKISQEAIKNSSTNVIDKGTLIISTRMGLGKIVSVDFPVAINQDLKALYLTKLINKSFFEYQYRYLAKHIESLGTGTTVKGIRVDTLKDIQLSIPPLNEQIRIANKLDSLLAKVDTAQARLEKIPTLLKRFRQSVLAAATSGELTREWRGVSERRDEFLTWKFSNIPSSWEIKLLTEVSEARLGKMLDKNKNQGLPTKYLGNINVRWWSFDLVDLKEILLSEKERIELQIQNGDLLLCEGGEPGRGAIWKNGECDLTFQKALHRVRFNESVLPEFALFCIENDFFQNRLSLLYTGTTIKHLTGKALNKYPIPIPPIEEQTEIVRRVESLFALADTVEKQYLAAKQRLDRLSQSLLAKAFRGELVPQDPNDEPAAELLKRIQAERQAQPVAKQKRSKPA